MLSKQTIYLFLSCSSIQTDHFTSQQLKQVYDSKRTFSYQSVYSTPKLWGAGCVKITNELSVKYLQQASAFYFHGSSMSGKAFTLSAASSFDTLYADFKRISQPPNFIQCGGRLFTCSVITKTAHDREQYYWSGFSRLFGKTGTAHFYIQESFDFLAAFRRTRLCFRRFQMRAWSHLNWQDFSKWFYSGLRWLLDKFHSVLNCRGKGREKRWLIWSASLTFFFKRSSHCLEEF